MICFAAVDAQNAATKGTQTLRGVPAVQHQSAVVKTSIDKGDEPKLEELRILVIFVGVLSADQQKAIACWRATAVG